MQKKLQVVRTEKFFALLAIVPPTFMIRDFMRSLDILYDLKVTFSGPNLPRLIDVVFVQKSLKI